MLRHIIQTARQYGMSRLSLETGAAEYFAPARTFYKSYGFVECPPFAEYLLDPNSVFMSLDLRQYDPEADPKIHTTEEIMTRYAGALRKLANTKD